MRFYSLVGFWSFLLFASAFNVASASSSEDGKKVLLPENLAFNKPATASGSQEGHDPAHAVDGDADTRWCAPDNGNGYWWQVDLQKPESITGCRINWEKDDTAYQYKIQGSPNAKDWQTFVEELGVAGRPQADSHKFAAANIRYVRVTVTKAPEGSWASFSEFEVWGTKMVEKTAGQALDTRLAGVKAPPGFERTYFAGPPDISYPTCLAAVPTGEVFVGVDQNGSLDAQTNRGWVVRCLDTDGDGVADKFNVFARMDSPRGLVFDHNTLYVMHPPVLEAYYDDNGDGVAGRSEVLVRGLGHDLKFRGADHTCNGVRMGIDGWLYIALGDYGALKAVGKDGKEIQVHGGGIVRVRPDGSDLEIVVEGTRNIYDVAIDPLMNLFTCDNTNDGDDWNVRLSHMIPTANYGYPRLFRHFSDEMMPTMVDYGGGAPTGVIFLDEPGFPDGLGHGLYACQWGWSSVTRHPLQPDGATFRAAKEAFVELPRPTGIAADGQGNLYVASWKNAVFTYNGPNAGFILRLHSQTARPTPFPDLQKSSESQLLQYLASPSAIWRFHVQREILRRGHSTGLARGLEQLAQANNNIAVRVAAIFTLKQLMGAGAQDVLLKIAEDEPVREYALKALADRSAEAANVPTKVFAAYLRDKNPAVRLQAVIALNRLGRSEAAEAILPLTAEPDVAISQVAFRALVELHASDVCFKAIDRGDAALLPGAMRVLRNLHEPVVVDGLIERLPRADPAIHEALLAALCRLYYRESDWDGSWWGTRPDTSGPYFKWTTWDQSQKIGHTLSDEVAKASAESMRPLLSEFQANKVELPGLAPSLVKAATEQPKLTPAVVELLAQRVGDAKETVPFLEAVVLDSRADAALRVQAFKGLGHAANVPDALDAVMRILTLNAKPDADGLFKGLRQDFVRDGGNAKNVRSFVALANRPDPAQKQIAYEVLLQILANSNASRQAKNSSQQAIDRAWKSPDLPSLLRAIGDDQAQSFVSEVRPFQQSPDPDTSAAAVYALEKLGQNNQVTPNAVRKDVIAKLAYEEVMRRAIELPGDARVGGQLFVTLNCVKCHTTTKSEPLKGPFLGDITARYRKPEIIESILRPSAQIAQGFVTTTVETKDGSEYDGFVVRESGDQIEIRNLAGATVIALKDIVKRGTRATSIMPDGLLDQMTPGDLASLLAYLQSLNPKS